MSYPVSHIARIINAEASVVSDTAIEHLLLDSRKIFSPASSLFFAIKGPRRDGHQFIPELYKRGVRSFVIDQRIEKEFYPEASFLLVADTLAALQQLAAYHRKQFNIPVLGITGSNGKTIVKEWLYQLLHEDYNIVRSPKSYNSQIGVPLSVWHMNGQHTLAIFEAGISKPGEMVKLEKIIQPTIGVFTGIGEAHSEGFNSVEQKIQEKKTLFKNAVVPSLVNVAKVEKANGNTIISASIDQPENISITIEIPFVDDASVQNALTCLQVLLLLNIPHAIISQRMKRLQPVNMRLELKK